MFFKRSAYLFLGILLLIGCSKDIPPTIIPIDPEPTDRSKLPIPTGFTEDIASIKINTVANANQPGSSLPEMIRDISGQNASYCHPDVAYFPQGFNGYKYWMVFTPYFGIIGADRTASLYENPSVVVSNDGKEWITPAGLTNPIQRRPALEDSYIPPGGPPNQGYWSDVDWNFNGKEFELYYRGCFFSNKILRQWGAKSYNNARKLNQEAERVIVRQTSTDGIHWTPLELVYTSNEPASVQDNHILSPSFIRNETNMLSYEVDFKPNYPSPIQTNILSRSSSNGLDFTPYKNSKQVKFINKPWLELNKNYSTWHLQAAYIDGYYFLCLAVGNVDRYTSDMNYLAYSKDGVNFRVFEKPLASWNVYRSAVFAKSSSLTKIEFGAVIGYKSGAFGYREFKLDKKVLEDGLK
ncbi:hypothetical protein [Sphingobacterium sp. HMA12]|uniref:hypothetical protein n=1 Tax=Sphingobacterium sp. HMA12 TaxID=2050894 RepID=UPI000CE9DF45|nr:hypothetical protein [Sphingobacterium sp. HMA12]